MMDKRKNVNVNSFIQSMETDMRENQEHVREITNAIKGVTSNYVQLKQSNKVYKSEVEDLEHTFTELEQNERKKQMQLDESVQEMN